MRRIAAGCVFSALIAAGLLAVPQQAHAWWRGGWGVGVVVPPVVVAPPVYAPAPVYVAPPPVVVAPPPVYAPPPVAYYPRQRVWIPAHWRGPYWVPGHWR